MLDDKTGKTVMVITNNNDGNKTLTVSTIGKLRRQIGINNNNNNMGSRGGNANNNNNNVFGNGGAVGINNNNNNMGFRGNANNNNNNVFRG